MAKIIINDIEFDFTGYSRSTYFSEDSINSNGYVGGLNAEGLNEKLEALAQTSITSISIKRDDDTVIYSIENLDAKIISIEESYNGMDSMNTNINLQFN